MLYVVVEKSRGKLECSEPFSLSQTIIFPILPSSGFSEFTPIVLDHNKLAKYSNSLLHTINKYNHLRDRDISSNIIPHTSIKRKNMNAIGKPTEMFGIHITYKKMARSQPGKMYLAKGEHNILNINELEHTRELSIISLREKQNCTMEETSPPHPLWGVSLVLNTVTIYLVSVLSITFTV
jgi:hypothetical protein